MLWVYDNYKHFNSFSAGNVFICQNLTSTDVTIILVLIPDTDISLFCSVFQGWNFAPNLHVKQKSKKVHFLYQPIHINVLFFRNCRIPPDFAVVMLLDRIFIQNIFVIKTCMLFVAVAIKKVRKGYNLIFEICYCIEVKEPHTRPPCLRVIEAILSQGQALSHLLETFALVTGGQCLPTQ